MANINLADKGAELTSVSHAAREHQFCQFTLQWLRHLGHFKNGLIN